MKDNELIMIWQHSKTEYVSFNSNEFLSEVKSQLKHFDHNIEIRNMREIIGASFVIIMFGTGAVFFNGIISKIGLTLGALYGIMVIFILLYIKKYKPENNSLPTKEFLKQQRLYLLRERSLLNNVIYWYLLPPFISCVLFFIGQNMSLFMLVFLILIVFSCYLYIYLINKSCVKNTFNPLIKKIDKAIDDLSEIEKPL